MAPRIFNRRALRQGSSEQQHDREYEGEHRCEEHDVYRAPDGGPSDIFFAFANFVA
jgi:hypothetical protein